jgi:regulator of sigma E protease
MSIVIFIIILLVVVLIHEFGHFFTAKKFGIRVDEFGFGFPPKLLGFKKGETEYTMNLLPIGGFVKIYGENRDELPATAGENITDPDEGRKFYNQAKWKQAVVLFAGVFMNFLLAWFLFSVGLMSGLPTSASSGSGGYTLSDVYLTVISIAPKSPAEVSGLKTGDKILSIKSGADSASSINPDALKSFILSHGDKPIEIGYIRDKNTENTLQITPVETNGTPVIGISMDMIGTAKLPPLKAFFEGIKLTLSVIRNTVIGLYGLIRDGLIGKGSLSGVSGPVGMVGIVGNASKFGFAYLLSFAALISVNLGIINLIPFPALDGGRLFFLLIEKIKGSAINPKVANTANMIGFGVLILLMLAITYHDVVKLF